MSHSKRQLQLGSKWKSVYLYIECNGAVMLCIYKRGVIMREDTVWGRLSRVNCLAAKWIMSIDSL